MESVYQSHFGLIRDPFNITPDPNFLYLSEGHKEALALLIYGIKARKGFVVLTGEVGTGKTTLIHTLLSELDGEVQTALVFNLVESPTDLLRYICGELGLVIPTEEKREIRDYLTILNEFLLKTYREGGTVSIIIDEAQNLSSDVLESIRLLSNFETSRDKLIQILLVGQPELSQRLNAPELRQLKQRVVLRQELKPLPRTECREYITRRIEVAGGTAFLFGQGAVETIYSYSRGTPRLINILCDNAMLSAYASHKKIVGDSIIHEVARDLCLTGPQDAGGSTVEHPKVNGGPINPATAPHSKESRRWVRAAFFLIALASLVAGVKYYTVIPPDLPLYAVELVREIIEKLRGVFAV